MPKSQYVHATSKKSQKLEPRGIGGNQPGGVYKLRCGHDTKGVPVVSAPGRERRNDLYVCPQGCGMQKRR